jgi:hypothetical protein
MQVVLHSVDRLGEGHWRSIMDLGTDAASKDPDLYVDQSMISAFRGDMYVPSSPQKE